MNNPTNKGTYNHFSPEGHSYFTRTNIRHAIFDIFPYIKNGNEPTIVNGVEYKDQSTKAQRWDRRNYKPSKPNEKTK